MEYNKDDNNKSSFQDELAPPSTDPPPPLPLDWTQLGRPAEMALPIRYPSDVVDISLEDEEIISVGTAGQKITVIGPDFSEVCNPKLRQLIFRSHLIKKMEGLDQFRELELLELYDNQIEALDCLQGPGPSLKVLDMSYNVIRSMAPVNLCPNLTELCKCLNYIVLSQQRMK